MLRRLPGNLVQTVITSPPYWGLRDYGLDKSVEVGSEQTPEEYITRMVSLFRQIYRVLRKDGTVWLNMGDSYASSHGDTRSTFHERYPNASPNKGPIISQQFRHGKGTYVGLKPGNLVGMPWRLALALQADGWILRQDVIWHKPAPMPESVTNRCTKAHEYLFLLTKVGSGYYYDAEAIKEEGSNISPGNKHHAAPGSYLAKNRRSVWRIPFQGYSGSHFAVFPEKLVAPCILAGTSEYGACVRCGAPWKRIIEKTKLTRDRPRDYVKRQPGEENACANSVAGVDAITVGWAPMCECEVNEVRPCVVLDPFVGSGTTCAVSVKLGRRSWGIDLSETYLRDHAVPRITKAMEVL